MNTKFKKILGSFTFAAFVVSILNGCSNNSTSTDSSTKKDNQDTSVDVAKKVQKTLSVNEPRCVGCGKCVRFDSEHFAMNAANGKAKVISQENLSSNKLTMAISACHDGAIILE